MKFFPILCLSPLVAVTLFAQSTPSAAPTNTSAATEPVEKLPTLQVTAAPSVADRYQLPQVTQSVTASAVAETVNLVDPEDAVKYFPSIFIRKRNYGDTQPVMETRVWGVSSSARSLVYADGLLLTALVANNNNIGAPRWGLVAPEEIERIDLMYGPFAAAYPGNSMGAVMEITTRMPEKFQMSVDQTQAWQDFNLYGTHNTFNTAQTAATFGDRAGKFSFWVSANFQDSNSQPLGFVTNSTLPTGTTGGYIAFNKLGQPADVIGASGLLQTRMTNLTVKAAYDLTLWLRAAYKFGFWQNAADSNVQTYLQDASGLPTFAGNAGFASGSYHILEDHSAHSLSLKTNTRGEWDFEATASLYRFDKDNQRLPATTAAGGTGFSTAGKVAVLGGTGWSTLDLKGSWHPGGKSSVHELTFGLHDDRYKLYNPTFNTSDWLPGGPDTSVATEGDGKTRTQAAWAQDAWHLASNLKATLGVRYEEWRAYDGYNVNGSVAVRQPTLNASNASPKATLGWAVDPQWQVTASVGQAYRYATASELYQLVTTGNTFTSPNPNLKPDDVLATELRLERKLGHGNVRLSLFQDDVHDAIISQYNTLVAGSAQLYSFNSNIDHVRARGVEVSAEDNDVLIQGLQFSGSLTYLDAKTLADQGQGQFGSAIGKRLPNIPDWRFTLVSTYHVNDQWTFTAAGRYSGKLYTTLDNADVNPNTYQGFTSWFVADLRALYRFHRDWSASVGVDNILNRKYFFFHPFPQRTVVANLKYAF